MDRAFEEFAAARLPALLGYARALTAGSGGGRDAEDLVQEALARTGAAWWRVRRHDDPEGYVRRTMLRLAINRWRRPRREVSVGEPPERGVEDPGMRLVESDLAVDELLRSLPPRMRVVLVLRYVDGLSDEVIADRLGIATGTVRSQAHRALAHVRAGLAPRARWRPAAPVDDDRRRRRRERRRARRRRRWVVDTLEQVVARRLESLDADRRAVPEVLERALRAGERRRRRRRVLGGDRVRDGDRSRWCSRPSSSAAASGAGRVRSTCPRRCRCRTRRCGPSSPSCSAAPPRRWSPASAAGTTSAPTPWRPTAPCSAPSSTTTAPGSTPGATRRRPTSRPVGSSPTRSGTSLRWSAATGRPG